MYRFFKLGMASVCAFIMTMQVDANAQVATGFDSYLALCDGYVTGWGAGDWGQLGDGMNTSTMTPVVVEGLTDVVRICAMDRFSAALKSDGTVWTWGRNEMGQLGHGDTENRSVPTQVASLPPVIDIGVGKDFVVALTEDSLIYTWGDNSVGQLGHGDYTTRATPQQIVPLSPIESISVGYFRVFAILTDGNLMGWGYNEFGSLGVSTSFNSYPSPVSIGSLTDVAEVASGYWNTIARKNDGTLWAIGANQWGQLGLGHFNNPVLSWQQLPSLSDIVRVDCGNSHGLALKSDGTLYTWGSNLYGQVGDGTYDNRNTPMTPQGLGAVVEFDGGERQTLVKTIDGEFLAFGHAVSGTFFEGNLIQSELPIPAASGEVCNTTSTLDLMAIAGFEMFPNPAVSEVTVSLSSAENEVLSVFRVDGQVVLQKQLQGGKLSLDTNGWPKGLYLVHVEGIGVTRKLVVY